MWQQVILETPFIQLIQPFIVTNEGIETHALNRKITFNFITKPQKRSLNILQERFISEINCLIKDKENQLELYIFWCFFHKMCIIIAYSVSGKSRTTKLLIFFK